MAYKPCCIEKLHKFIYTDKHHLYNYVRCCTYTYYALPHMIDGKPIMLVREKNEDEYYFITSDKEVHVLFKITDFPDPAERDRHIATFLSSLSAEETSDAGTATSEQAEDGEESSTAAVPENK